LVTIIKFGGSLITEKNSRQRKIKYDVLEFLCEEIAAVRDEKIIIIHGGGSYGHPVAKKCGIPYGSPYKSFFSKSPPNLDSSLYYTAFREID